MAEDSENQENSEEDADVSTRDREVCLSYDPKKDKPGEED